MKKMATCNGTSAETILVTTLLHELAHVYLHNKNDPSQRKDSSDQHTAVWRVINPIRAELNLKPEDRECLP